MLERIKKYLNGKPKPMIKFDRFDFHGGYGGYKNKFPSDRIYLPQAFPVLGTTFTLEAWVYSKSTPTMKGKTQSIKTIIGDESNFSGNYKNNPPMITFNDELSIKYGFGTGSASIRRMVKNVRSDDTWQHVAYTFDGTISHFILFFSNIFFLTSLLDAKTMFFIIENE